MDLETTGLLDGNVSYVVKRTILAVVYGSIRGSGASESCYVRIDAVEAEGRVREVGRAW